MNAQNWIQKLNLAPHPEGGYYRELYHSQQWLTDAETTSKYGNHRRSATSIYFLLQGNDVSRFHRLKSDEIWYYHAGHGLTVHTINPSGQYQAFQLGLDIDNGQAPQICIPAHHIFGATLDDAPHPEADDAFALVSCMVSPGFDFADFELFDRAPLLERYPEHEAIINRLTKA